MIRLDVHGQHCALRVLWPWREHGGKGAFSQDNVLQVPLSTIHMNL